MQPAHSRRTMIIASGVFLALGLLTAALGPALPDLARRTGNNLATLGTVFSAMFLGALLAQLVAGPLSDRLGQRPVLVGGLGLFAAGIAGVALSSWLPLLLVCAVIAGLGHGAIDVSTNVLIAEVFAERGAAALNLLNVFFGVGAISGPLIAGLTLRLWGTALPALWAGVVLLVLLVPLTPLLATVPRPDAVEGAASQLYRAPLLWAFGLLVLVYVGVENGIGGWTAAYVERTVAVEPATAALAASGFWLALTVGRVIASVVGLRVAAAMLLLVSLGGSLAGALVLALSVGSGVGTLAGVLLLGLSFGPIFPTALAILTTTFAHTPGRAAGVTVAMGSLGGMSLPWLQGIVLERFGPGPMTAFVVAGALLMLLAYGACRLLTLRRLGVPVRVSAPEL